MSIKTTVILALAFGALCQETQAQKTGKQEQKAKTRIGMAFEIGVAQVNYTNFPYTSDIANAKPIGSFSTGLFVEIPIGRHWAIQPEVVYSQLGYRREVMPDYAGFLNDFTDRLNYIETPLSVKYRIGRFRIEAGVKIGFIVNAPRVEQETANVRSREDQKFMYASDTWSALFGIEYDLGRHFGLQWRYSLGLNDVVNHSITNGYPSDEKIIPSAVRFGIHYKF